MSGSRSERTTDATGGDDSALAALLERHRRELHVHCYRMLAAFGLAPTLIP